MTIKLFLTGVTGYIGGDAFYEIHHAHPEYEYSLLVRSAERAKAVQKTYPNVRIVQGELDDYDLLREEAAKADIVLHTADASDHEGAAKAIAAGLSEGHNEKHPGYWLHTGGTGILTFADSKADRLGEWDDKEYNDWEGVDELTHLPDDAFHRNVDKIVLKAGTDHGAAVKTALVCPPTIYGSGRGPVSGRGRQVYELAKLILDKEYVPIVGSGKARWNHIHVADLSKVFLLLVDAAVAGKHDPELWGAKGYYLTEAGEHMWSELAEQIGKEAHDMGYIKKPESSALSKDAAMSQAGFEAVSWGLNSRGRAERARRLLGWQPTASSLSAEIPVLLISEQARMSK